MKKCKKGWVCPVCGAVMNPKVKICINCQGILLLPIIINPKKITNPNYIVTVYSCPYPNDTKWERG